MKKKKNEYVSWYDRALKEGHIAMIASAASLGCSLAALIITMIRLICHNL